MQLSMHGIFLFICQDDVSVGLTDIIVGGAVLRPREGPHSYLPGNGHLSNRVRVKRGSSLTFRKDAVQA